MSVEIYERESFHRAVRSTHVHPTPPDTTWLLPNAPLRRVTSVSKSNHLYSTTKIKVPFSGDLPSASQEKALRSVF
jgi:hypothetical protein